MSFYERNKYFGQMNTQCFFAITDDHNLQSRIICAELSRNWSEDKTMKAILWSFHSYAELLCRTAFVWRQL